MPRPMKRSTTTFHQFVQRIPADLKDKVRGMTLVIPIGEESVTLIVSAKAHDIRLSLRTRDPAEAKARQAAVVGYLEGVWRAVREGPQPLSQKQIVALAGVLYREHMAMVADEPGPPDVWHHVARLHRQAREAGKLESWIGGEIDELLAREGILTDAESRERLMSAASDAEVQAATVLKRYAEGDYTPDEKAVRFPEWKPSAHTAASKSKNTAGRTTVLSLFEKLAAERAYAPKTVSEWTRSLNSLTSHAQTTDAASITPDHLIAWTDDLVAKGLSAKTINETYLAAAKALFKWARGKRYLTTNPALETPKIMRRDEGKGKRGFTLAEALVVLKAAQAEASTVRRWVPWLLAYSGARAGEIMQLRPQDVRQEAESGLWLIDITPDAGRLKNKASARVVPLHPHLIELGFADWTGSQKADRLFYEERPGEAADGKRSTKTVAINRLADWVRSLDLPAVKAGEVSPNHGWRHRFTTELVNLDVPDALRKRLTGHTLEGQDNRYVGRIVLERLHQAVTKLPRFES